METEAFKLVVKANNQAFRWEIDIQVLSFGKAGKNVVNLFKVGEVSEVNLFKSQALFLFNDHIFE